MVRPSGMVAFLFTDIEGSTGLWERHPEGMRVALSRHDAILRAVIEEHGGYVFSTAGDAFMAAYERPLDAVASAVDAQRRLRAEPWPSGVALQVRVGIHVGAAHERDGDYFGPALNRAARLMALAHGGQTLLSLAAEELVRDDLPAEVRLWNLGEHVLRGLSRPEVVFQITAADLPGEFPPLGTATSVPNNLPVPATSFIARDEELEHVSSAVGAHRLVTLVGPGGVGKTRLAIEAATAAAEAFPDGVRFVDLGPLVESDAVVHAFAAVLSVSPAGGSLLDSIVNALEGRAVLLVADNCEHVVDAVCVVVEAVRRRATTAAVLATSREPLRLPGERVWEVSTLEPRSDGVRLFCDRAEATSRAFTPTEQLDQVAEICELLDGMPLAIELAASRVRAMSLDQLARGLDDRFRILRNANRSGVVERHQTLEATVEWSYRLLTGEQRLLFDRLSVFAGSFDLDAVETVCGTDPIESGDVFDLLSSLVDKSLLHVDTSGPDARYRLLETLRLFAAARLTERGHDGDGRDRHLAHFTEVARIARGHFEGSPYDLGRAIFAREWDNLRVAVDWAERSGAAEAAGSILLDAMSFAYWTGRTEHDHWMQRAVASTHGGNAELLAIAGFWLVNRGGADNYLAAERLGFRAIEATPDDRDFSVAWGWFTVMAARFYAGRLRDAWIAGQEVKRAAAHHAGSFGATVFLAWSDLTVVFQRDDAPAILAAAVTSAQHIDNPLLRAYLCYHQGTVYFAVGAREEAYQQWSRSADLAARCGCQLLELMGLLVLALRAPQVATDDVRALYSDLVDRLSTIGSGSSLSIVLVGLADWFASNGNLEHAAHLLGFLDPSRRPVPNSKLHAHASQLVSADSRSSTWLTAGAEMTRDEIVAYCLERQATPS